jgi:osmotically-inducible protein OsmY
MFGTSQVGNPAGATAAGTGTGMTMGQGSTNGNANIPSTGASGTTGNSLGLGANMQNFTAGGATGFVGSSANSISNQLSRVGTQVAVQAGRVNFGSLTNLMNQSRQNQFNQQQAQKAQRLASQAKGQFRIPLKLGFEQKAASSVAISRAFDGRMIKIPALSEAGRINTTMEAQTAVLRGTVRSEADRALAESLANLEPGVMAVRNELVVAPTPPTASEQLPPQISRSSASADQAGPR